MKPQRITMFIKMHDGEEKTFGKTCTRDEASDLARRLIDDGLAARIRISGRGWSRLITPTPTDEETA